MLRALSPELNFLQAKIFDRLEPLASLGDRAFLGCCLHDMYGHLQDLLNRHDRLSMAASVELRVPYLENRLIDFAIHLPRRYKYRDKQGKWLLKKVAEKHIPLENVTARKNGFEVSAKFTLGTEGLLRGGLLRDAMKWPAASVEDLVDLAKRDQPSRLRLVGMELFFACTRAARPPATSPKRCMRRSMRTGDDGPGAKIRGGPGRPKDAWPFAIPLLDHDLQRKTFALCGVMP
ncbi:asparagine synthase-related protein [Mesorhizobium sp. ORM6]